MCKDREDRSRWLCPQGAEAGGCSYRQGLPGTPEAGRSSPRAHRERGPARLDLELLASRSVAVTFCYVRNYFVMAALAHFEGTDFRLTRRRVVGTCCGNKAERVENFPFLCVVFRNWGWGTFSRDKVAQDEESTDSKMTRQIRIKVSLPLTSGCLRKPRRAVRHGKGQALQNRVITQQVPIK